MYFFFILFFVSLGAIIFMIGRKLLLINDSEKHIHHFYSENFLSDLFDFDKLKNSIIKNGKKFIHILIWITLRTYILSLNFINKKRTEIALKIRNKFNKNNTENTEEAKEPSKYIKMISEYRHKIRKIKHKIKQEELKLRVVLVKIIFKDLILRIPLL